MSPAWNRHIPAAKVSDIANLTAALWNEATLGGGTPVKASVLYGESIAPAGLCRLRLRLRYTSATPQLRRSSDGKPSTASIQ